MRKRQVLILFTGLSLVIYASVTSIVHASTTTTFQPSAADNYLRQDAPTTNYGGAQLVEVQSRDTANPYRNQRTILKFDMNTIPTGATVISVTPSLIVITESEPCPLVEPIGSTELHRQLGPSSAPLGTSMMARTAGAARAETTQRLTPLQQLFREGAAGSIGPVAAQVQYALNSAGKVAHYLIRDETEDSATQYGAVFYSKGFGTSANEPKLVVTYSVIGRIGFITSAQVLTAGSPSGIMTIQTLDASGVVNVPSDTTIDLTSTFGTGNSLSNGQYNVLCLWLCAFIFKLFLSLFQENVVASVTRVPWLRPLAYGVG